MQTGRTRRVVLLSLLLGVAVVLCVVQFWPAQSGEPAARGSVDRGNAPDVPVPPAALRIRSVATKTDDNALLDPADPAWQKAAATQVLLNRTPRLYQTEPANVHPPPGLEVRALRSGDKLLLRLEWDDATKNAPEAPPRKQGEGGLPEQLYKRPTGETATFADAAAVMVPERWTGPGFPSLQMGDKVIPVRLFYWNASRGPEELSATGRATPQPTGRAFPARAAHGNNKWTLTVELPEPPDGYPVAFAIWDGQAGERDGMKCFSIWYVLSRA